MTAIKGMVAAVAIAAVAWPSAAVAARQCPLRSILGTWTIEQVVTEEVTEFPANHGIPVGDIWEETRHIRCSEVRIERVDNNRARGIIRHPSGCENTNALTEAGIERQRFLLMRHRGGPCSWSMVSEAVQQDYEVLRSGVLGTRGGINIVRFGVGGEVLVGSGSFAFGIGDTGDGPVGSGWPHVRHFPREDETYWGQGFVVTLFGLKQ